MSDYDWCPKCMRSFYHFSGHKFCRKCGSKLGSVPKCNWCGSEIKPDSDEYCRKCGRSIKDAIETSPPSLKVRIKAWWCCPGLVLHCGGRCFGGKMTLSSSDFLWRA